MVKKKFVKKTQWILRKINQSECIMHIPVFENIQCRLVIGYSEPKITNFHLIMII